MILNEWKFCYYRRLPLILHIPDANDGIWSSGKQTATKKRQRNHKRTKLGPVFVRFVPVKQAAATLGLTNNSCAQFAIVSFVQMPRHWRQGVVRLLIVCNKTSRCICHRTAQAQKHQAPQIILIWHNHAWLYETTCTHSPNTDLLSLIKNRFNFVYITPKATFKLRRNLWTV